MQVASKINVHNLGIVLQTVTYQLMDLKMFITLQEMHSTQGRQRFWAMDKLQIRNLMIFIQITIDHCFKHKYIYDICADDYFFQF